jgi:hypothetical protein
MTEDINTDIRQLRSTSASPPASAVWANMLTLAAGGDGRDGGCSSGGAVDAATAAGGRWRRWSQQHRICLVDEVLLQQNWGRRRPQLQHIHRLRRRHRRGQLLVDDLLQIRVERQQHVHRHGLLLIDDPL